jgi:hypothetical protein
MPEHRALLRRWLHGATADTSEALQAPWVKQGWFDDAWIQEYVRDTNICHAWHIHVYLMYRIMPTQGGKRMGGSDFMASSLT